MADLLKGLFNKKKKVVATESEKPVASTKPTESAKSVAPAKSAKSEEKAQEPTPSPAPEVKAKGRLGGLFGSRKNSPDFEPAPEPTRYVAPKEDANSFFLDADSAKTFGDIDYMRTSKAVRKTFPKVLGAKEGAELIESTSSMDKVEGGAGSMSNASKSETPEIKPSKEVSDRRSRDMGMDMFRNMAKDIKR
jgi:hypothetical protein